MRISGRLLSGLMRAIVLLVLLSPPAVAAPPKDWKTVRIGLDLLNPPFSTLDADQQPTGFDVAIAKALCERMRVTCTFIPNRREMLVPDLLARKTDAVVASLAIVDDLKKTVDFSDRYRATSARMITTETSGVTNLAAETLRGKTVGALQGTRYATFLGEVYGAKGTIVKLYANEADAENDVARERIAAYIGDPLQLYRWFESGAGGRCCQFVGQEIRNARYLGDGAGIAVRKEDGDLRDMINRALADLLRDGSYEKINAMYFHFSVY